MARQNLATPLRIAASVIMLAILIPRVHLGSLLPAWTVRTALLLGAALAVTLLGILLSTLRWSQVLSALGLRARVRTLFSAYLAGQFVGNFLPSTIGGDVLRVTRATSATGNSHGTFASVVLERLTGWLVLPVITLSALVINPDLQNLGVASRVATLIAVGTLVALAAVLVIAANPRLGGRLADRAGWLRFIGAVHLGLRRFRHRPGAAIAVLTVGFAYQLVVVLAAFLAARALGLGIGLTAVLAFMPVVAIAQVLPFSLGGLGIREGALVVFLSPLGVTLSQAVALGLLVYGLNLAVSLLGAPAFAAGPKRRPTATATA